MLIILTSSESALNLKKTLLFIAKHSVVVISKTKNFGAYLYWVADECKYNYLSFLSCNLFLFLVELADN